MTTSQLYSITESIFNIFDYSFKLCQRKPY